MNKGHMIGFAAFAICSIFWYTFSSMGAAVPMVKPMFDAIGSGLFIAGFIVLFYTYTFEGNIWVQRRFLSANVGVGVLHEAGRIAKFFFIDFSKDSVELYGQLYAINQAHISMRRGSGIPYIHFNKGTVSSIDLSTVSADRDADFITRFIKQNIILWKTMAFDMMQNKLFLFVVGGFALTILILLFLFLGVLKPTQEELAIVRSQVAQLPGIINATCGTAVPAAIGGVASV